MNISHLILGSNLGNRESYLSQALQLIDERAGKILSRSSLYNTAPWGSADQDNFLNQAIAIKTGLDPGRLLETILEIEKKLGRIRIQKWEARTIDIDILFYNSDVIQTPDLTIPHPFLHERKFVLVPLAEIAGNFIHPLFNKSITRLLEENKDNLSVSLIKNS